jgi:uncharacterized protein
MKKSRSELEPELPFSFQPCSNGEFAPPVRTDVERQAEQTYRRLIDAQARRLGITRRAFTESACGMVAGLWVMNQAAGCGHSSAARSPDGGFDREAGFDVPGDVSADQAAQAAADAKFDVDRDGVDDQDSAQQSVSGDEFVFDVQVHNRVPKPPWGPSTCDSGSTPMLCPTEFLREIFVASDTQVACLSGFPAARAADQPSIEARAKIKEIVDRLGGSPRLVIHANVRPAEGAAELDAMELDARGFPVAAWKTYPERQGLDTDEVGRPFIERARQLGIKVVAAHRGIGSDGGAWDGQWSPRDVVSAAKASPDFVFLVYHAGWQNGVAEDHPFNPADPAPRGVDRLIKAVLDAGLGSGQAGPRNVYAELGSTWFNLMRPQMLGQAAHVMGKLLKYLGPDRILWGTDCVLNGNPQTQIAMLRAFSIPESMQAAFGYPALTPEVKRKILGLNAAGVYRVDVQTLRRKLTNDDIAQIKLARRADPRALPPAFTPRGPRTRREYLAFLRWSGEG